MGWTQCRLCHPSALEAHIEAIYDSPWFTRLWITQEVSLATKPLVVCGGSIISWKELEVASRIFWCGVKQTKVNNIFPPSINNARNLIHTRARNALNIGSMKTEPILLELDQTWNLKRIAWRSKDQDCKDDRDRVYALLSIVSKGTSYRSYVPKQFMPDYNRSVEWAYSQFWARYGGYSSLFHASLSRRGTSTNRDVPLKQLGNHILGYDENYLPSWCPELRPNTNEWKPIFSSDYAASTPTHHMECHQSSPTGPGPLMIRGHRFDVVTLGFHMNRKFRPSEKIEDLVDLRQIVKLFISLRLVNEPDADKQAWIDTLDHALMTDMPSGPNEEDQLLQYCLSNIKPVIPRSKAELKHLWRMYIHALVADVGVVRRKFEQALAICWKARIDSKEDKSTRFRFDPTIELTNH